MGGNNYDETGGIVRMRMFISGRLKHFRRKPTGAKKKVYDEITGTLAGGDGRLVHKTRVIDNEADRYIEHVVLVEDGSAIVDKDHALSEHYKHHGTVSDTR